jgi:hypothetical protein
VTAGLLRELLETVPDDANVEIIWNNELEVADAAAAWYDRPNNTVTIEMF